MLLHHDAVEEIECSRSQSSPLTIHFFHKVEGVVSYASPVLEQDVVAVSVFLTLRL